MKRNNRIYWMKRDHGLCCAYWPHSWLSVTIVVITCLLFESANAATVPFVGCKPSPLMDGGVTQSGNSVEVNFPTGIASELADYVGDDFSVLAPRGWSCTYNMTGQQAEIDLVPENDNEQVLLPKIAEQFFDVGTPSAVMHTYGLGEQLFPKIISLSDLSKAISFIGLSSPQQLINSGRIIKVTATDRLKYLNKNLVQYTTPAETSGIGSQFLGPWRDGLTPGTVMPTAFVVSGFVNLHMISTFSTPIDNVKGICIFGVRLPANLRYLAPYILTFGEQTMR